MDKKKEALQYLLSSLNKKNGAALWNQFRRKTSSVIPLVQAELNEADLKGYNLTRVDLTAAKLFNADLTGVDLSYSNLSYADLSRANLAGAFLTNSNLTVARLKGANMVDTNLDHAILRSAKLGGAYLVGASLLDVDLQDADLRGACLKFCNLTGSKVKGANIEDADLSSAIFTEDMLAHFKRFSRAIIGNNQISQSKRRKGNSVKKLLADMDYEDLFPEEDCYRILGIDKSASLEEIQQAYKKRVKEYHPDRVVNLGEKIKIVARREFERIQLAYKSLTRHRSKPLMQVPEEEYEDISATSFKKYSIDDYLKLIVRYPNNDRIYYNLGLKYFEAGLVDSAMKAYEKALKLNPGNIYAKHNLKIARLVRTLQES